MPEARHLFQPSVEFRGELPKDQQIARLAEAQHGVVTLAQLRALGLGAAAVAKRASAGRLHRVHRGVYAVGRLRLSRHGRWLAAVSALGPGAVLSHRSAAALWGIAGEGGATSVSVPRPNVRGREGVRAHRTTTLTPADITTEDGIPCTTVARTLVDLGDVLAARPLDNAVAHAEHLRLFDLKAVEAALARAGRRRGVGALRASLARYAAPALTKRELERRFLRLCEVHALPRPEVNAPLQIEGGPVRVDFLWRAERLVVETDGFEFHSSRRDFENDRLRDQRLTVAGFSVVRFSWRQTVNERRRVAATLQRLLARGGPGAARR